MKKFSIILASILLTFTTFSQSHHYININGFSFDPDTLNCYVGDTVTINLGGYHNAVEVSESSWLASGSTSNNGFNFPLGAASGTFVIDTIKHFYYVCTPHVSMGMKAIIISHPIQSNSFVNLFFSEASEGSSNNKYFEVFNPTSQIVDLENYAFAVVNNSPTTTGVYEYWVNFDSAAVILPHDVYVVAHPSADSIILSEADQTYYYMSNGDDGIGLVYGSEPTTPSLPSPNTYQVLDWIGNWEGDPGSGWDVAGISNATKDHTIVRKCNLNIGDTLWSSAAGNDSLSSQWIVFPQNDWSNIGFHNLCLCDSLNTPYYQFFTEQCGGYVMVGDNIYDSTGIYLDTLLTNNGCDSIVETNLVIYNSLVFDTLINICYGDSVMFGNSYFSNSGVYTFSIPYLFQPLLCDSITYNLQLNVYDVVSNLFEEICEGDSLTIGNSIYYLPGNYSDTLINSNGCDSIINTMLSYYQLSPLSIFSFPDPPNICLGDSIVLEGSNGFSHYWWSDINGDIINTDDRLVITPDSDTWYLLTAKDTNDCVVKEDIIIYVDSCVNSSLSFYSSELTKIFPNPVINNLTINHASIFNNVKIYNIFGDLLLEKEMLSFRKKTELNLQNLPTGVYYVHLYANHLLIKKKSFIKVLE